MVINNNIKSKCQHISSEANYIFKRGICTVEASIIIPFIFMTCLLMISGMAYTYDRLIECGATYGAAIYCSKLCGGDEADFYYPLIGEVSQTENIKTDAIISAIWDVFANDLDRCVSAGFDGTDKGMQEGKIMISHSRKFLFIETVAGITYKPVSGTALTRFSRRINGPEGITERRINAADTFNFIREADLAVEYIRKAIYLIGGNQR